MINRFKDIIYNLLFRENVIISSDSSLKGKVVVITGASKGIGKSTAEILLSRDAKVVVMSRDGKELEKTFINKKNCLIISGDVSSENDCKRVFNKTIEAFGKIDVLINNAGIFKGNFIENMSEKDWDALMSVNLKGVFLMSKSVISEMKKNKKGLILNIGSKISHNRNIESQKVAYATTKYAVEGFSYALGNELKPFGIRVSCLMPATVNTFRSLDPGRYLSQYKLAEIISMLIKHEDVHFESIILKSVRQDI